MSFGHERYLKAMRDDIKTDGGRQPLPEGPQGSEAGEGAMTNEERRKILDDMVRSEIEDGLYDRIPSQADTGARSADWVQAGIDRLTEERDALRAELKTRTLEAAATHKRLHDESLRHAEERDAAKLEVERLRKAHGRIGIGGNHLASALIGWLGAGKGFPPYSASLEEARAIISDVDKYDVWICWRTIMLVRDELCPPARCGGSQ